ncbi:THAP domain-containing protein 2-like, partial [Uloborus diversus]|uniref:THAP domain-containing protein 2-like n=1 Tax=Uloborus diversus TaxID=327109 RepID=UPI00240A15E2
MPRTCCIPFCTSRYKNKEKISFLQIPADVNQRALWLNVIKEQGKYIFFRVELLYHLSSEDSSWYPNDFTVICEKHFKSDDFKQGLKRKILKQGAVPSIFSDNSNSLRPPKKRARLSVVELSDGSET